MNSAKFCGVLVFVVCAIQGMIQAQKRCERTNPKPFRFCLDKQCKMDGDCGKKQKCLCDGDCGWSCVDNDLRCDRLSKPKNGEIKESGSGFGQTVTYKCKKGYTMRGSEKRTCRGIGKWDGKKTRCPRLCKHPGDIAFGNNNGNRRYYKVGHKMSYWCFPGYEREGPSRIQCTKAGTWKPSPPKCKLPSCQKPKVPDNAIVRGRLKDTYKYNELVVYSCDYGYFTAGDRVQRCLTAGKWTAFNLKCIPKSCGDPGTPKNGRRRGYVFTFKKKVYYECNTGYERLGPEFRLCQSNQKWSDKTPTCEPVDCGTLPTPEFGQKIEETKTTYLGRVTFQCNKKGFELKGSRQRVCRESGRWDGTLTKCARVECKDPGTPAQGGRNPDMKKYVFENKIEYSCKTNHTLRGDKTIICQDSKTWTGSVPKCLLPCKDPGIPKGGSRRHHSFLHGDKVSFSCNKGWKMEGEKTISCSNGEWNHETPKCLEGCSKPRLSPIGYITPSKDFYNDKETVWMDCYGGYVRIGDGSARCRNGKWNNDPPSCKRKCFNPGRPYHGSSKGREYFEGKQVSFRCQNGYDLIGLSSITCLDTGRWSGSIPQCKRRCRYRSPANSRPYSNTPITPTLKHGATIDHNCIKDYTLVGQKTSRCNDGRWQPSIPTCKAPCKDPGIPKGGSRLHHSFLHGDEVSFSCNKGWKMGGERNITCNDGRWNHKTPKCLEGCSKPRHSPNGYVTPSKDFYNDKETVWMDCYRYYVRVGDGSARCRNGKWNNDPPSCKRKCSNPGSPYHGWSVGREYFEGKQVSFTCQNGYDVIGLSSITCLDTGRWSGSLPLCKRRCSYRSPANSRPYSNTPTTPTLKHGTTIDHNCIKDYTLVGEKTITCNDGRWSIPTCKAPCADPGLISHGNRVPIVTSSFLHGSFVRYICNKGYTLDNPGPLICNDGKWSKQVPSCKKTCDNPGILQNGRRDGYDFQHNSDVTYKCNRGTKLVGSSSARCINGTWSSPLPKCLEICPYLVSLSNGEIHGQKNQPLSGDKVSFSCDRGYDLVGTNETSCIKGRWNGTVPPNCVAKCQVPNYIKSLNSSIKLRSGGWISNGTKVKFSCPKGQILDGNRQVTCRNGAWSPAFPECKVPCKIPGAIQNGTQNGTKFKYEFKCNGGYSMDGQSVIHCVDGRWNASSPRCYKNCGDIGSIKNAIITQTNQVNRSSLRMIRAVYNHGDQVSIRCKDGYRIDGNPQPKCQDGKWSDSKATCIGVCKSFGVLQNGEMLDYNFDYGSTVRFRCHHGYSLRGNQNITCINGSWNNKPAVCKANCRDPGNPVNGQKYGNGSRHLDMVRFSCDKEFIMDGATAIKCFDGKWSSPAPVCKECGSALGMENRKISDSNIHASSIWLWKYDARNGRLNKRGYAWCSSSSDRRPYLEIDLGKHYKITYVATQGLNSWRGKYWVSKYIVSHSLARSAFIEYREKGKEKLFDGNKDGTSIVKHKLKNPFIARKIQFKPVIYGSKSACMRVEVYGCDLPTNCVMVGSRVLGRWSDNYHGGDMYYRAYVKTIDTFTVQLEIEDDKHNDDSFKTVSKRDLVLDVPNTHLNLRRGTRVLIRNNARYYTGTIRQTGHSNYLIYPDNSKLHTDWIKKKDIRVLKQEQFCE